MNRTAEQSLNAAIDALEEKQILVVTGDASNGHRKLLIVEAARQTGYFHVACFDQNDEIMDGTKAPMNKDGVRYLVPKLFPVMDTHDVMRFEMSQPLLSWNRWMYQGSESTERRGMRKLWRLVKSWAWSRSLARIVW